MLLPFLSALVAVTAVAGAAAVEIAHGAANAVDVNAAFVFWCSTCYLQCIDR